MTEVDMWPNGTYAKIGTANTYVSLDIRDVSVGSVLMSYLTPDEARNLAAALIKAADDIAMP